MVWWWLWGKMNGIPGLATDSPIAGRASLGLGRGSYTLDEMIFIHQDKHLLSGLGFIKPFGKTQSLSSTRRTRHRTRLAQINLPFPTMPRELFLNTLDPQYTRYIDLRHELEAYLAETYGKDINFQVAVSPALRALICLRLNKLKHESDRWSFYAPTELDKKQIRKMTKEIVRRRKQAAAAEEEAEAG